MPHPYGNVSTHIPEFSGNIETVPAAGTLVVDTGLKEVQAISATLLTDSVATAAAVTVSLAARSGGGTVQATLKTWNADGATAGSTAASVSWMALGK